MSTRPNQDFLFWLDVSITQNEDSEYKLPCTPLHPVSSGSDKVQGSLWRLSPNLDQPQIALRRHKEPLELNR